MHLCHQCREPVASRFEPCPKCGAGQVVSGSRVNPAPPRHRPFIARLLHDLTHPASGEGFVVLLLLLVVGAAVGAALAGMWGLIVGGLASAAVIVLAFVAIGLLSSSE